MSSFATLREETEARLKAQFERILASMDLVRRDEFEAVQAMAVEARKQNQALAKRLDALEGKTATKAGSKSAAASAKTKTSPSRRKPSTSARSAKPSGARGKKS